MNTKCKLTSAITNKYMSIHITYIHTSAKQRRLWFACQSTDIHKKENTDMCLDVYLLVCTNKVLFPMSVHV